MFKRIAIAQVILVVVVRTVWFWRETVVLLSGPHEGDLYAFTWDFQIGMFFMFHLPKALLGVALILFAEYAVYDQWVRWRAARGG